MSNIISSDAQELLKYFSAEGYQASIDSDGDILFKCEGIGYALCFDSDDAGFGKLILPNIWHIDDQAELDRALSILDGINRRMKVVKGHTMRDQVWFTVEIWLGGQEQWSLYLQRAVRALAHAMREFGEQMRSVKQAGRVLATADH